VKLILSFLIALCTSACFGQQRNVYLISDTLGYVGSIDHADYIRIVSVPDSGSALYNLKELYKGGTVKLIGKCTDLLGEHPEGSVIGYFENGKRRFIKKYKDEALAESYEYYPNSKLYINKLYHTTYKLGSWNYDVKMCYNSLGNAIVTDGTGEMRVYNPEFTELQEIGMLKNGKRIGTWTGQYSEKNIQFTEVYGDDGKLLSGTGIMSRDTAIYTDRLIAPLFPGGEKAFGQFLSKIIRYPNLDRRHNSTGRVILAFWVEKDGQLTHIRVVRGVTPTLDAESIRVLRYSPNWIPGKEFGFLARVPYTIPVNYALETH
jgi:TonB family protein